MEKKKKFSMSAKFEGLLPDGDLEVCEENLREFWYWITERHNIWRKRFLKEQAAPWTKDPILKDKHFCNVYRELDRNSIWIIENVIKKQFKDEESKLFALMMCRLFNNPETFERCGIPDYHKFNPKVFKLMIEKKMVNEGKNPFTQAYLINSAAFPGIRRYEAYCLYISKEVHAMVPEVLRLCKEANKPEEIIKGLIKIHGVAHFIAYEIYCDLDYWNGIMKFDQNDYVNVGPGAVVGTRLIFPTKGTNKKGAEEMIHHLKDNQKYYLEKFDLKFKPLKNKYGSLTLREIEHSLCEYQKYFKEKHNVGKQRLSFKQQSWSKSDGKYSPIV